MYIILPLGTSSGRLTTIYNLQMRRQRNRCLLRFSEGHVIANDFSFCHVSVLAKRFVFERSSAAAVQSICLLSFSCTPPNVASLLVLIPIMSGHAWWRWHSWTRRSARRPPMRGSRRHRSREWTRGRYLSSVVGELVSVGLWLLVSCEL